MSELSDLTLKIFDREQTGRNANNKIRSAGRIPVILYGKEINKRFSVEDSELRTLLRKSGGTTSLFRLLGESGEDELVLIKELQNINPLLLLMILKGISLHLKNLVSYA